LEDEDHRDRFDEAMEHHPPSGDLQNLYYAQVVWDESMAEVASKWLLGRQPARQAILLAGVMHCHSTAVPGRIARRTSLKAVSVLPLVTSDADHVSDELDGYDFGFVMTPKSGTDT
jgi:uncharacterized iron-regulated protein